MSCMGLFYMFIDESPSNYVSYTVLSYSAQWYAKTLQHTTEKET